MSDIPWVKFYAGDFLNGVADLSPHEISAYTIILMRIYDEDRAIPNDPQKIARRCNMRPTQCSKAIKSLISEGKLFLVDGCLDNNRAIKERESRHKLSTKQAKNARSSVQEVSEKPNENNESAEPRHSQNEAMAQPYQKPEARSQIDTVKATVSRDAEAWKVHENCCELVGVSPEKHMAFASGGIVSSWLGGGADPELDIYPTIRRVMASRDSPPGSMQYFTKAVADAKATREQPLPAGQAKQPARASPAQTRLAGFSEALNILNAKSEERT